MIEKSDLAAMSERQPLLASVNVAPQRPRYRYANFARIIAILFSAGLVCFFFVLFFVPSWKPFGVMSAPEYAEWPQERVPLDDLKTLMLETPDEELAREWSQYYTSGPHLAGKNLSQAVWTQQKFFEFGIPKVEIVAYDIYTNYPV
jgi:N-acetylated-alpha-linked acidic dipeptidase